MIEFRLPVRSHAENTGSITQYIRPFLIPCFFREDFVDDSKRGDQVAPFFVWDKRGFALLSVELVGRYAHDQSVAKRPRAFQEP